MSTIDSYILMNKKLLSIIGIQSNYEQYSTTSKTFARFRLITTIIVIISFFVPQTLQIMLNWGNLQVFTEVGCIWLTVILLLFKVFYVILRKDKVESMYLIIRELWEIPKGADDKQIYENTAWQAKICTYVFCYIGFLNNISFTVGEAATWIKSYIESVNGTDVVRHLQFNGWYGYDVEKSPNYEIVFCWQTIATITCNIAIIGLDTTLMTMTLHICGQFKIIQNKFRKVANRIIKEQTLNAKLTTRSAFLENMRKNIDKCIHHHQRMINIANDMEDLINPVIFAQFMLSGMVICLSGFTITTVTGTINWIKFTNYLASMLVQLAIWCWPGEVILQESGSIGDVVFFEIPWYELPKSYQADFILVIMRAQKRCYISAAKFQIMSVEKFGHVLSTAASYFTLLRQLNSK